MIHVNLLPCQNFLNLASTKMFENVKLLRFFLCCVNDNGCVYKHLFLIIALLFDSVLLW